MTLKVVEQVTPRQSHGADRVDGSHPERAPVGSMRLSLMEVRASISTETVAFWEVVEDIMERMRRRRRSNVSLKGLAME